MYKTANEFIFPSKPLIWNKLSDNHLFARKKRLLKIAIKENHFSIQMKQIPINVTGVWHGLDVHIVGHQIHSSQAVQRRIKQRPKRRSLNKVSFILVCVF